MSILLQMSYHYKQKKFHFFFHYCISPENPLFFPRKTQYHEIGREGTIK